MAEILPPRKKFGSNLQAINTRESEAIGDPWLMRAREAFDASTTFIDSNLRKDWEDSIRHFQNKHMAGSKYYSEAYKYRSKSFRPKTRSTIRQVEAATAASFFSQLEVISYEPEDDKDPINLAGAELRQELINYRLSGKNQIPWFQICVGGMQEAQIYGVVVSKQFWDYQDKKKTVPIEGVLDENGQQAYQEERVTLKDQPDIKLYPIENVRFDPASEWTDVVNSSPYFIAMEAMRIGDIKLKISRGEWNQIEDAILLTARNSAYDSTRQVRSGDREDDKDSRYSKSLSDFDLVWVHENFMRIDGEEFQYYTLSTLATLSDPKPLNKAYLHNIRPFVVGTCVIEPHKAIPDSPVHLGKGMQKKANELDNSRDDAVKFVLNKRYLVKRGKQVDLQALVRNAPGSIVLVNDIGTDVQPIEYNDIPSSAFAEQDRVNVDFDELFGSFSAGSIATNRKLGETVGGLQMLRGTSNTMGQYLIRVFSETWVEKVLNQIDELEQYYESDLELLQKIAKRCNLAKYGIEAVTTDLLMSPARISVNIANSAMDPTVRLELFTFAMQKYSEFRQMMPPDMDPEPVKAYIFGLLGFRDASRFSVSDDQDPKLAAAEQMIQQLQQALESKMTEIQAKNEAQFAKIQSDQQIKIAELQQEDNKAQQEMLMQEREAEREAKLQIMLANMSEQTKLLIAQISAESKAQATESSNETKALAATLQASTQQAIAEMKSKENNITYIDTSAKSVLEKMFDGFQEVAQNNIQSNEAMNFVMTQLQENQIRLAQMSEKLMELGQSVELPRENEIIERDEEGVPTKTRSRVVRD